MSWKRKMPIEPERQIHRRERIADHATEALDAAVGGAAGAVAGIAAGPIGAAVGAAAGAAVGAILGHSLTADQHARDKRDHELDDIDVEEEFFEAPHSLGMGKLPQPPSPLTPKS
jgi:hypothetical protein